MYMYQAAASFTGDLGEAASAFLVLSSRSQSRSDETFSRFRLRHTSTDSIRLLGLKGGCVTDRHYHTAILFFSILYHTSPSLTNM